MLTQLATVKARLGIAAADTQYDDLLTRTIEGISARFDRECNRRFARTVGATQEFAATEKEIIARCYPVEAVTKFEVKSTEAEGWAEQTGVGYVLRQGCVISLVVPLSLLTPAICPEVARVTYTGGYVLPGVVPGEGQAVLPDDIEVAAIEQIAVWFQQRDKLGLFRHWPNSGTYTVISQLPLLPQVSAALRPYRRWCV